MIIEHQISIAQDLEKRLGQWSKDIGVQLIFVVEHRVNSAEELTNPFHQSVLTRC